MSNAIACDFCKQSFHEIFIFNVRDRRTWILFEPTLPETFVVLTGVDTPSACIAIGFPSFSGDPEHICRRCRVTIASELLRGFAASVSTYCSSRIENQ